MRLASKTIDPIANVLKRKNISWRQGVLFRRESPDESVEISRRVFAGNDQAKVTILRPAEVVDVRRMDSSFEKFRLEPCDLLRVSRMNRDDRAGPVVDWKAGFAKRGLDVAGVEVEAATKLCICFNQLQRGEPSGGEREGQGSIADEEPAPLDYLSPERSRAGNRATVGSKGLAQRDGLDESRLRLESEMFR